MLDFIDEPGPEEFFLRFPLDFDYVVAAEGGPQLMISRDDGPAICLGTLEPVRLDEMDDAAVALAIVCAYLHNAPEPVCKAVAEFFTADEMTFLLYANSQFARACGQSAEIQ